MFRIQGDDFGQYLGERELLPPDLVRGPGVGKEDLIEKYHEVGTKVISYITFSNRYLDPDQPRDWRFRLADAPELCIYDEKSVRERSLFADQVDPRRLDICQNTEELVQEMLREVRLYMEAGLDGIFVDHGCGVTRCYGEELGVHEHIYHQEDIEGMPESYLRFTPGVEGPCDDPLSNYAYAKLLGRAMEVMDEYGKDKIIAINSTFWPFYYSARPIKKYVMYMIKHPRTIPGVFWDNCHAGMLESHITVPRKYISPDHDDEVTIRWGNWNQWLDLAVTPEKYIEQGKRQLALAYYGKDDPRDDAFFSFATAKLSNLIWDSGGEPGRRFCKFRLGLPIDASMKEENGIFSRRYERGFVAVNPGTGVRSSSVESDSVVDYYSGKSISSKGGMVSITIPPESGRIFLMK
jgi:hypothetical protein